MLHGFPAASLRGASSAVASAALAPLLLAAAALAQESGASALGSAEQGDHRQYSRMSMKLERTLLKIDVLELEVTLSEADARRLARAVEGREPSRDLSDDIAEVAINAERAILRTRFLRNITLEQFVNGARKDLRATLRSGVIDQTTYDALIEGMPDWFGFLEERGIRPDDELQYRISGDTLRTAYRAGATMLMQRTDVDSGRTRAVLGTYFVWGSQFRDQLIASLFAKES